MFSEKCLLVLLLSCFLLAFVAAQDVLETESIYSSLKFPRPRQRRSPQHGSVVLTGSKDERGREAILQYNHNLFTSRDGRGSVDAYANANRNFDQNRNDYAAGIQGRWRF